MALGWLGTSKDGKMGWTCGYCGRLVGGNVCYLRENERDGKIIYICPHCENPTAFILNEFGKIEQYPGACCGCDMEHLPESVSALYSEIRRCVQYSAYTAAVLAMRKLLMHVAVDQGAPEGLSFAGCVDYLSESRIVPATGAEWVGEIRKAGNEAAHEIVLTGEDEAVQLLEFTEMLLKVAYEFPAKLKKRQSVR